ETVVMPNLIGLALQQSRILLTENGLCQGILAAMPSPTYAAGHVLAQDPPSGTSVDRQACVDLLISAGAPPRAFKMTDLSGLTLASAIRRLESLQLTVGPIHTTFTDTAPLETVVDQQPLAGHRVVAGSPVSLAVNRSTAGTQGGGRDRSDETALFRYALENGFLKKRVQVLVNRPQMSLTLFDEYMAPGQDVWLLIPKNGNPTVLVYVDGQLAETRMLD
ncbi:MAG TPA: PASTA domain-containing protein, partial [Desulfosarcina sp.]|nr:PASTA domain-containing protein [Desulfosarcina sp.]